MHSQSEAHQHGPAKDCLEYRWAPSHHSLHGPSRAPRRLQVPHNSQERTTGPPFLRHAVRCSQTGLRHKHSGEPSVYTANQVVQRMDTRGCLASPQSGPYSFSRAALEEIFTIRILTTTETYCVQTLTSLDLLWIKGALWIYTLQKTRERDSRNLSTFPKEEEERGFEPNTAWPLWVMGFSTMCSVVTDKEATLPRMGE